MSGETYNGKTKEKRDFLLPKDNASLGWYKNCLLPCWLELAGLSMAEWEIQGFFYLLPWISWAWTNILPLLEIVHPIQ